MSLFVYICVCGEIDAVWHREGAYPYPDGKYRGKCGIAFYGDGERPILWAKHGDRSVPLVEIKREWVEGGGK